MDNEARPLWKLLMLARSSETNLQITCEECFALLEYDAELLANGAAFEEIRPIANHHLSLCPTCTEQFKNWLEKRDRV